jgi:atypical dual specificity phosphatase
MLARIYAKMVYYPTLAYNVFLGRILKVRNWWDRVNEHCVLGAVPLGNDPVRLKELGITGVVNMCEEYPGPVAQYQRLGIEQLWLPTTDFQHPTADMVEQGANFIEQHKRQGGQVYVHCKAGRARSATIVLWWLVKYGGMSPQAAQHHLLAIRKHVNPRVFLRPVIVSLAQKLGLNKSSTDLKSIDPAR